MSETRLEAARRRRSDSPREPPLMRPRGVAAPRVSEPRIQCILPLQARAVPAAGSGNLFYPRFHPSGVGCYPGRSPRGVRAAAALYLSTLWVAGGGLCVCVSPRPSRVGLTRVATCVGASRFARVTVREPFTLGYNGHFCC